jgi:hypothetical protein
MSLTGFHPSWDTILSHNLQAVADQGCHLEGCHLEGSSPYKKTAYRGVYCTLHMPVMCQSAYWDHQGIRATRAVSIVASVTAKVAPSASLLRTRDSPRTNLQLFVLELPTTLIYVAHPQEARNMLCQIFYAIWREVCRNKEENCDAKSHLNILRFCLKRVQRKSLLFYFEAAISQSTSYIKLEHTYCRRSAGQRGPLEQSNPAEFQFPRAPRQALLLEDAAWVCCKTDHPCSRAPPAFLLSPGTPPPPPPPLLRIS